jgi:predicted methyltransferase
MRLLVLFCISALALAQAGCTHQPPGLGQALSGDHRSDESRARDVYRHPAETLAFFGVRDDMSVVEIWPGPRGWYTEILAPLLRENGKLYAAQFPPDSDIPFYTRSLEKYRNKLASRPDVYDRVEITYLYPPEHTAIAPPGSADAVLTFRNVHNWAKAGNADAVFRAMYEALKPGGILGVVEHRARPGLSLEEQISNGYMTEKYVIDSATAAGFAFEASSDINANPRDSTDHPAGVWSLPPTLRNGQDKIDYYLEIGESDRMTLKFIKPANGT